MHLLSQTAFCCQTTRMYGPLSALLGLHRVHVPNKAVGSGKAGKAMALPVFL